MAFPTHGWRRGLNSCAPLGLHERSGKLYSNYEIALALRQNRRQPVFQNLLRMKSFYLERRLEGLDARSGERHFGDQSHNFTATDGDSQARGFPLHGLEGLLQRCLFQVRQVHGNL